MKELIYFSIGLVFGAVIMKNRYATDELKKELERERARRDYADTVKA